MIKVLEHLEGYISEYINLGKTFLSLVKYEARLAGQSIFPLVLNICMLFVILLSVWLTTLIVSGYYLYRLLESLPLSCAVLLIVNAMFLAVLMRYLSINLKNMSFVNTREFLADKEPKKHELTEKNEIRDNVDNKEIKQSSTSTTHS